MLNSHPSDFWTELLLLNFVNLTAVLLVWLPYITLLMFTIFCFMWHPGFYSLMLQSGHPSKYWADSLLLNFIDQVRIGVLSLLHNLIRIPVKHSVDYRFYIQRCVYRCRDWIKSYTQISSVIIFLVSVIIQLYE